MASAALFNLFNYSCHKHSIQFQMDLVFQVRIRFLTPISTTFYHARKREEMPGLTNTVTPKKRTMKAANTSHILPIGAVPSHKPMNDLDTGHKEETKNNGLARVMDFLIYILSH